MPPLVVAPRRLVPSPTRHPRLNPQAESSLLRNAASVSFVCMRKTPPHEMRPRLRLALPHLPTHCSSLLSFAKSICLRRTPFLLARSRRDPKPHFNLGVFPLTKFLSSLYRITHSVESSELPLVRNYGRCPISSNNRLAFHSKRNVFSSESRLFDCGELKTFSNT